MRDKVILVNEQDEPIGVAEKLEAHHKALLHRAFSVFIFNNAGEMLLQQRALGKYHSAGLWTNACCSHPQPGEDVKASAEARLKEEMGFTTPLTKVFDFIYTAPFDNGLTEHEFDHVFTGVYSGDVVVNEEEVMNFAYLPVEAIRRDLVLHEDKYTVWFRIAFKKLEEYLEKDGVQ